MALIVEDGTIVSGAESYISVSDADTYHANLGDTTWDALTTAQKESSLRKATFYMLGEYGGKWLGYRKSASQTLDWPRESVLREDLPGVEYVSDTIVPVEVKNACAALAVRASSDPLLADETQKIKREKVDVIETEYSEFSPQRKKYLEVDQGLRKYLKSTVGAMQMIRV